MNEILSRQNLKFKGWLSLLEARGIKKTQRALISGRKLVTEFLAQHPGEAAEILVDLKMRPPEFFPPAANVYALANSLFSELDVLGTRSPLLVVKTPTLPNFTPRSPMGLELIVALSDPGNLGAVLRSAEAFAVSRVILTQEACSPFLPRALRAASGATFRLKLTSAGPLKELQLPSGYSLDLKGEDLAKFAWPENLFLILGEEGRGVPANLNLKPLAITMGKETESLNAMAAASIALFSYRTHVRFLSKH